jgi:hypothetical protein
MPVYLDEYMVGTNNAAVCFPHLLLCMGLLCMTDHDLFGMHLGIVEDTELSIDGFKTWLQRFAVGGDDMRALYGAANFRLHYGKVSDPTACWKAEMNQIATRFVHHGPIRGFDTSIIEPKNGTYVEFRSQLPKTTCRIFFERNEKLEYTVEDVNVAFPVMARVNPNTRQIEPVKHIKTSASVAQRSKLREVDYSVRLASYLLA